MPLASPEVQDTPIEAYLMSGPLDRRGEKDHLPAVGSMVQRSQRLERSVDIASNIEWRRADHPDR